MRIINKVIRQDEQKFTSEQFLTSIDKFGSTEGSGLIFIYENPIDGIVLIDSLKKSLSENPYFCGRILDIKSANPRIVANNAGVIYTEINYEYELPETLKTKALFTDEKSYFHGIDETTFDENTPLLQIKHTKFSNGSIIGFTICHALCDATSLVQFLKMWSNISRNKPFDEFLFDKSILLNISQEPSRKPRRNSCRHNTSTTTPPKNHQLVTLQIPHTIISSISATIPKKIKSTENDVLVSLLWKISAHTAKGNLSEADSFPIYLAFNTRKILEIGKNYFGNAMTLRSLDKTIEEIIDAEIGEIANWIRALSNSITKESLLDEIARWSQDWETGTTQLYKPNPNGGIAIDNLGSMPIYDIDFSAGPPVWFSTTLRPTGFRYIVACKNRDSFHCYVSLPADEISTLKDLSEEKGLLLSE